MSVKPRIKKRMKVLRNINLFRKRRKRNCYRQARRDRKKMLLGSKGKERQECEKEKENGDEKLRLSL